MLDFPLAPDTKQLYMAVSQGLQNVTLSYPSPQPPPPNKGSSSSFSIPKTHARVKIEVLSATEHTGRSGTNGRMRENKKSQSRDINHIFLIESQTPCTAQSPQEQCWAGWTGGNRATGPIPHWVKAVHKTTPCSTLRTLGRTTFAHATTVPALACPHFLPPKWQGTSPPLHARSHSFPGRKPLGSRWCRHWGCD